MKPTFPCLETTIDCSVGDRTVRLWIGQDDLKEDLSYEVGLISKIKLMDGLQTKDMIYKLIALVPKLNAVQVKLGSVGVMIYTVDF